MDGNSVVGPVGGAKTVEPVEYNVRDLILYALGIGSEDLRYIYEKHEDFAAFPTYPVVLCYKGVSYDALPFPSPILAAFPNPPMRNSRGPLDAGISLERLAELPKGGGRLKLAGGVASAHKKGKGALVERAFDLMDDTGKVYYKFVDASYMVGADGFEDFGPVLTKPVTVPSTPPKHRVETKIDPRAASLYRLSGDYNPLHVDPEFAKMSGFDAPILHGKCTFGHATRALLDTLAAGDHRRFRSLQLRLVSPVIPGQTLVTEIWEVSTEDFLFQVLIKETGKVCIGNGRFQLTPASKM
ncbi:Peroxisomal multifunctional enzyme type 2 [Symbiodinium microadriaticum]|uniref:Peroxisomal multifunctional enzyme type 2 n=1 Tax=Symbiodinium microadriaticum TaxID=2951 RepID=A0A1Q9ET08_SYMMI|nr:Peroxisomal multifunctional enzyme type 2 [Symbiodinium microadriaticum]CAE7200166.1 HSD17B4 [Symbiodinium microadriaticum]